MKPNALLRCGESLCSDVLHERFDVPGLELDPDEVRIVLVAEAPPRDAAEAPLHVETTLQAFRDAGADVASLQDVLDLGVYPTTAVKCAKTAYALDRRTVDACSVLLEVELGLFPFARALLLMGDVAIRAVNAIAKRNGEPRAVPAGATYRLRGGDYRFRGMRVFPSYVQAGPAFWIEKQKRRMIAEDIAAALTFATSP